MSVELKASYEPLPGYRLIDRLGSGGFGEVWKCEAPGGFHKAIKFVHGTLGDGLDSDHQRAEQELRAMGRIRELRHPFILTMERFDIVDGRLTIVMELADRNLDDRLRQSQKQGNQAIPRAEMLRYAFEIADALDFMNAAHDLQHLDIKPQNIFLVGNHIKVADFGLVKDLEGFTAKVTGGVTPIYSAPETFDGWVSRFSDQYSFAVVLQEMLTGRRPFAGPTARQYMMQHMMSEPDLSSLPAADRPVIARALDKDPNKRFPTCKALVEELSGVGTSQRSGAQGGDVPRHEAVHPSIEADHHNGIHAGGIDFDSRGDAPIDPDPIELPASLGKHPSGGHRFNAPADHPHENGTVNGRIGDSNLLSPLDAPTAFDDQLRAETKPFVHLDRMMLDEELPGDLCPTLVVGLGETGLQTLEKLHVRLRERYGAADAWPAIRMLAIDSDPQALSALGDEAAKDYLFGQLQLCRMQKANSYFKRWDELKHLKGWLDPNVLFQITPQGSTSGYRSLGRLAFIEHYRRLLVRVRDELGKLLEPGSLARAESVTGVSLGRRRPKVVVVAGMGGGVGSGMFLDFGLLADRVLREAGDHRPDVQGVLWAGVKKSLRGSDQHRVNHFALAQNILDLVQPNAKVTADYGDNERHAFEAMPFQAISMIEGEADGSGGAGDRDNGLDQAAGLIFHQATTRVGRQLDKLERGNQIGTFRTACLTGLVCRDESLYRLLGTQLASRVVNAWLDPNPAVEAGMKQLLEAPMVAEIVDDNLLRSQIRKAADAVIGERVEVAAARIVFKVPQLAPKLTVAETAAECDVLLRDLQTLLGTKPAADPLQGAVDSPYADAVKVAVRKLTRELGEPLADIVRHVTDEPGPRLQRARAFLVATQERFLKLFDVLQKRADETSSKLWDLAVETRLRFNQLQIPGLRRADVLETISRYFDKYAELAIDYRLLQGAADLILSIRGRLSDLARDLVQIRQRLDQFLDGINKEGDQLLAAAQPACENAIYPGGFLSRQEVLDWLTPHLSADRVAELDARVQLAFAEAGGFPDACLQRGRGERGLPAIVLDTLVQAAQELVPSIDAAESFLERHAGRLDDVRHELAWLLEHAKPSVEYQQVKATVSPSREKASLTLALVPESPAGEAITDALQNVAAEAGGGLMLERGGRDVVLLRLHSHRALQGLLPRAVMEARAPYQAACRGKLSPDVFAELASR